MKSPLFATDCLGATISCVEVFPTHVTYQQKLWRDITVASHMIASVETHAHEHGFVVLKTTSRQRIICMVRRKQADALCAAIRDHLLSVEPQPKAFPASIMISDLKA